MAESIKKILAKGIFWNIIEKFFVQGVGFVIGIILARLLSPSDYGLMGMLVIFIAISNQFVDGGLFKALIQKKDCSNRDYSTVFVTNFAMAVAIYGILFICAPYIASFYEEPILTDLTRVIGLNFILGSFNSIQRAKLQKSVDFKSLAKINAISHVLSGLTGVVMAYNGFGVWALVGQSIVSTIIGIFLFPLYSKWKLSFQFSFDSFKQLFGFGSKLMITGLFSIIINNISTLFIGKTYNSSQLGYYTKGQNYPTLISNIVYGVLGTVTFPVLSNLQDDKDYLVQVYKKCLFLIALVVFPAMILVALLSKPLVLLLLTEKWLPCVVFLQIKKKKKMFTPLSALNMNILNAVGRSDLFMKLDFSKAPLILGTLAITIPISVEAIVWGNLFTSFICFFINAYLPGKMFGYGAWDQIKDWKFIFLSLFLMSICVILICTTTNSVWLKIIIGGIIGVSVYIGSCLIFGVIKKDFLKSLYQNVKSKYSNQ